VLPEPVVEPPVEKLLVLCPSCAHEQHFAASCDKCGVIFARYRPPEMRKKEAAKEPAARSGKEWLRSAVWPAIALLGLLLLWIFVKDSIPTTFTTIHETVSVTSGLKHSAAVRSDGTVWTWGDNKSGQLGDGRRDAGHALPHKVPGLEGFVAVAAGERHTLALKKDGTVWSWGDNEQCQLGDPSGSVGRSEPAQVAGLEGITAIASGDFFSVALRSDGTLWHFGNSFVGGKIDGRPWNEYARPRLIEGISDVAAIAAGRKNMIALKKNGSVWCWGENGEGQCGDGGKGIQWEPKEVAGLDSMIAVAAGEQFALALKKDGKVWGWGALHIASGKNLERQSRPAQIPGLSGIKEIRAGYWLALALRGNGTVWHSGVVGRPAPGEQRSFADILKRSKVASTGFIFAGGKDAFLEKRDGTLLCWGLNDFGKPEKKGEKKSLSLAAVAFDLFPADGATPAAAEATPEQPELPFQAVAAGSDHCLALARDGTVWAWGENEAGQVAAKGIGSANTPRQVCDKAGLPLEEMVAIAAGYNTSLAVKRDGSLWFWGQNLSLQQQVSMSRSGSNGQWSGGPQNYSSPARVDGVQDAVAVAGGYGGYRRFVVLHGSGWLSRFGDYDKEVPVMQLRPLGGVTDIVALAGGARHFAALKNDGSVWTWGGNDSGQLGNGSTTSDDKPQRVAGIGDVVSLAAGNDATLTVKRDGTVWGWGKNIHGVTRKGLEVTSSLSPMQIAGLKDIAAVSLPGNGFVNGSHFLAVDRSGRVWSWGFNSNGQLGQGTNGHDFVRRPAIIEGLDGVTALAAGSMHSLALRSDGTLRSWGKNSSGQLGNASGADSAFPVKVVSDKVVAEKKQ
jgi:alpha-tubulin suppressor-like RCC1 family protein